MTTEQASSTHKACSLFFENEVQCRAVSLLAEHYILNSGGHRGGGDKEGNRPQVSSDFEKCEKDSLVVVRNKQYIKHVGQRTVMRVLFLKLWWTGMGQQKGRATFSSKVHAWLWCTEMAGVAFLFLF